MVINKMELCDILNIKTRTLKQIESNNKLCERLENKGYKLINRTKEGRSILYEVELINENKEVYSNLCKYVFNTNKEFEFAKYFISRIITNDNNIIKTNKDIAIIVGVSNQLISNWDNTLINNKMILKNGYYYICVDNNNKEIRECTKEEYKSFYRNKSYIHAFKMLQHRFYNGEITLTELQVASADIGSSIALIENKYYYRIKKYINNTDNKMYIDTLELIKSIYNKELHTT